MRLLVPLVLFLFFGCETPADSNGDDYTSLTSEDLSISFDSCYGSLLENRSYSLGDPSFDGKAIVVQYVTGW